MNPRCIVLNSSIFFCFLLNACFAQSVTFDTAQFYNHLKQNHLFSEQLVFNKQLQQINSRKPALVDSLKLDVAMLYFQTMLPDSCKKTLLTISNNFQSSKTQQQQYLSLLLVNKEYAQAQKIIANNNTFLPGDLYQNNFLLSLAILKKEFNKNDSTYNPETVAPLLLDIKTRYIHPPHYSPALAGVYSIVPGLGKLYIGYKKQALTSFIANMLLAAQAAESYVKSGIKSPRFIITASLFSVFYTGNIIGSITAAKKKKKDYYNELDYEILNYYSAGINQLNR